MSELKNILYVEDDDDIRNIASMVLELGGLNVKACNGGEEALAALEQALPDLALVDVMMPGMDGLMLFEKMKEKGYKIPVVFMTAKTQKNEIEKYMESGVAAVISKPFNPDELVNEVQAIYETLR